jgi:hypothetical protein
MQPIVWVGVRERDSADDNCRRTELVTHTRDENRAQLDARFEISVDFCLRSSLGVTLVSQLAPIDHHFFLDFIFQ